MRMQTYSWIGVGWKPVSATIDCKKLDPVLEVEKKHREAQEMLLKRQANYKTKAVSTEFNETTLNFNICFLALVQNHSTRDVTVSNALQL